MQAKITGAGIAAPIGAFLGSMGGPGGSLSASTIAMGVGGHIGRIKEEVGDAIDPDSKTDLALRFEKRAVLKRINNLTEKIGKISENINTVLQPIYNQRYSDVQSAKRSLQECRKK